MMNQTILVPCCVCGRMFETTRAELERQYELSGCANGGVACPKCDERWEQTWKEYMHNMAHAGGRP